MILVRYGISRVVRRQKKFNTRVGIDDGGMVVLDSRNVGHGIDEVHGLIKIFESLATIQLIVFYLPHRIHLMNV
jgi:hypothetical protein